MSLMTQVGIEYIARDRSRGGTNSFNRNLMTTSQSVQRLGSSLLRLAGVGGGIYMLQRGLRNVIAEASRAQETIGKFNVVFGDNARAAALWAEEFGNSVGRSTTDIQEWMASVQDLFVPLGFARDKATGLSESLVKLAVDVASFSNKIDADVIRDFTSALVGNHETVRKYGIIISENAIKQEALNQGINKTYKELTDLEKVSLRMALIQKGSTDAQGDAIRTSDNYANQVKRINANYQELSVTIGEQLIPALSDILVRMNAFAENGNFVASMHERIATVYEFADAITNLDELFALVGTTKWSYKDLAEQHRLLADVARAEASLKELQSQIPQVTKKETWGDTIARHEATGWNLTGEPADTGATARTEAEILAAERAAAMRVQITARMYSDMGQYGDGYYQAQVAMLDLQKADYARHVDDKVLLEQWYASELKKIDEKILAETQQLANAQLSLWDRAMQQREELWRNGLTRISAMERDQMKIMQEFMDRTQNNWVNFWDPVIDGSKSAKEAMHDFFRDFLIRLAQAYVQMQMLNLWNAGAGSIFGGIGGAIFGGGGGGGGSQLHSGWVPDGVPSFHGGRGLKSNERVAVIENDELLAPDDQIIKSGRRGGMGGGGINFQPQIKMVIVRNEREAYFEAMNSAKGEKVIVHKMLLNRNLLS